MTEPQEDALARLAEPETKAGRALLALLHKADADWDAVAAAARGEPGLDVVQMDDLLNRAVRGLHSVSHRGSFDLCETLICHDSRAALRDKP